MSKTRIDQKTIERCLLTEIVPYETPILFSNWGSFNYCRTISARKQPDYLSRMFSNKASSIPYKFRIRKDGSAFRTLSLVHPKHSGAIVDFYTDHDVLIAKLCKRSIYSLRAPSRIAKFYVEGKGSEGSPNAVEDITADTAYASSYFKYSRFSHLYKFFDSDDFTELEKRFGLLLHVDIVKCFPSIYTHSISWAVRGKTATKESLGKHDRDKPPFDVAFDKLLQDMNYKETNGIAVGPELSRIFAEIILQRIDASVYGALEKEGLRVGVDYWCCRYIDDYFVFINSDELRHRFVKVLSVELEKYKLYLNAEKNSMVARPFISDISIMKIQYSDYLKELSGRVEQLKAASSHAEINRLRAIFKGSVVSFSSVSNFLMSAISRQILSLARREGVFLFDALYVFVDLAFYVLRMDMRVSSSYKIASVILDVVRISRSLEAFDRSKVLDKVAFELRGALETASNQHSSVECMNLLIAYCEISETSPLPAQLLRQIVERCRKEHSDEYSHSKRLTYFEIVSLLYVMRDNAIYTEIAKDVLLDADAAIKGSNPLKYAETGHLLLDLVACPFLANTVKEELVKSSMSHEFKPSIAVVREFSLFVSRRRWYFDWNQRRDLKSLLKKKELLLAY